jgi:hypothetical protein
LFILVGVELTNKAEARQLPNARIRISQQAAYVAAQPAKVSAKLLAPDIIVGSKPQIAIALQNADNQPVAAPEDWGCQVSVRFASGKSSTQSVWIKKGQSTAQFEFLAEELGFASIVVQPLEERVRPDRIELIVHPEPRSLKKGNQSRRSSSLAAPRYPEIPERQADHTRPRYELASFRSFPGSSPAEPAASSFPPPTDAPVLHISLGDPSGVYRANGKDAARITIVFESTDLSPAPVDIHIWLKLTNGVLDPPQPLQIKKGSFQTTTQLTSLWPAEDHLMFVSSTPSYQAQGDTDVIVHFVPAGAVLVGPDTLSVVDTTPVMLVFYNADQNPVAPGKNWPVTLRSKQSKLQFTPASFEVQASSPTGSAVLLPISWGSDTVEAVVANYTIQPLPIRITFWMILGLCLSGGLAGGLAAYNKFKGSWAWRIFLGILGGAVLCWLYVYLALPNVTANIAHNTFSVFFVAVVGGYGGTTILDLAAKRLGWVTP